MQILEETNHDYEVVDYIKNPPTEQELQSLAEKMGITAKDFIRSKERTFS